MIGIIANIHHLRKEYFPMLRTFRLYLIAVDGLVAVDDLAAVDGLVAS